MTTETTPSPAATDVFQSPLIKEMIHQIRAQDSYGFYRNYADELLIKPFIVSKEAKRKISVDGEVEPITKGRIQSFYRAIAALIEKETGQMAQVVVDLSHEGFGSALIYSGRLLVVNRTLRDAQRFGFDSAEKLAMEGEKLVQSGIAIVNRFPDVCRV
ncbi:hypothetical protein BST81_19730 [Leptolyngbya sp. 'hensonii']|uniref:NifX-associated nitrogen fixation protein n=1 Tax=Leptolyngbya sp. 'hensonii' TaxID=1922337 RepID=UPI00094FAF07|nr:NifX-associated nitrogen fixation protein [Leptolyngbya sp. 'hensonii']OLP16670.1 hypothetical protein BST81_19730 [Leptolyngbya sp. 'hensonii']